MYYDKTQSDLDLMEYDFFYEGCDCCGWFYIDWK
jgi:hypothetical protein